MEESDELEALRETLAADPDEPGHHAALAGALHRVARYDEAIEAHRGALAALHRQLAAVHYNLGTSLAAAGRLVDAAAAYRDALHERPAWSLAHHNLGALACADGDYPRAVQHFEAALAAAPEHAGTAHGLAIALTELDRLDEAIVACERAIALDDELPGAHTQLAALRLRTGDAAAALVAAMRACAVRDDDPIAHGLRGAALTRLGRHAEAAAAYDRARAIAPERADVHHNCALGAEALGDLAAAAAAYRDALAIEPQHVDSLVSLARVLVDLGRTDEVMPIYERLLAIEPGNTMIPHLVAGLRGETTAAAPRAYVVDLFDGLAPRFEALLVGRLGYRVPALVGEALDRVAPGRRFDAALDLGCGTGLVGEVLRTRCRVLHGVDLSTRMLDEAAARQCYDELYDVELVEFLQADGVRYDLAVATDVLIYIGDLAPLLTAAARRLAPGGLLACSIERADDADVILRATGRYAHRRGYVERLAAACGLAPVAFDPIDVRHEASGPVPGWLFVLARA